MYKPSDFNLLLQDIDQESATYRKAAFLRFLLRTLLVLHGLALVSLLFRTEGDILTGLILLSIGISIVIALLFLSKKSIKYAAIFTIAYFNMINLAMLLSNIAEKSNYLAVVFGCLLAFCPVITGMLYNTKSIIFIGLVNIISVPIFISSFGNFPPEADGISFLIGSFIFIATGISWYVQRSVQRSQKYIDKARTQLAQDTLLRQELAIARDLQSRLYPTPPQPAGGIVVRACALPAMETSGDLYDFIILDEYRMGIVIADVTGKSIAAALLMAMTRATFRSEARRSTDPATVLNHVNAILCADESIKQMVTAWYGIFDRRSLTLRFANAGHPFPLLLRQADISELEAFGFPLRGSPETVYQAVSVDLAPGDHLLMLTDGALEAMNPQHEIFGYERLYSTFTEAAQTRPHNILDSMQQSIANFHNPAPQTDDLTMILLSIDAKYQSIPLREKVSAA